MEGIAVEDIQVLRDVDMQFQGQTHLLTVEIENDDFNLESLHEKFAAAYWDRFSVTLMKFDRSL